MAEWRQGVNYTYQDSLLRRLKQVGRGQRALLDQAKCKSEDVGTATSWAGDKRIIRAHAQTWCSSAEDLKICTAVLISCGINGCCCVSRQQGRKVRSKGEWDANGVLLN